MPARILIADDSRAVRSTLRSLLTAAGHEVEEAEDGQQAVERAEQLRPDLIVIDLAMPNLDGLNASLLISQQLPGIPIIMCTMHWAPHLQTEAKKFGVRVVISKTDSKSLIAAVTEHLAAVAPNTDAPPASAPLEPFVIEAQSAEPVAAPSAAASMEQENPAAEIPPDPAPEPENA